MTARIWAVIAGLAVIAILVVAWIMGDAQPTRWIETPVAAQATGSGGSGPASVAAPAAQP